MPAWLPAPGRRKGPELVAAPHAACSVRLRSRTDIHLRTAEGEVFVAERAAVLGRSVVAPPGAGGYCVFAALRFGMQGRWGRRSSAVNGELGFSLVLTLHSYGWSGAVVGGALYGTLFTVAFAGSWLGLGGVGRLSLWQSLAVASAAVLLAVFARR